MMRFNIVTIQHGIHSQAFAELSRLLVATFATLGMECSTDEHLRYTSWNVILGYNLISDPNFLKGYRTIIYQLEQLSGPSMWRTPAAMDLLRSATVVWDYAQSNIEYMRTFDIEAELVLPTYHSDLATIRHDVEKDIDILFYGSLNDRRTGILDALKGKVRVVRMFGVYGQQRDDYIARAKIVLNIHFYESMIMEQVRLSYLLSNQVFVVSEVGADNPYENGLLTASYDRLVECCVEFLDMPLNRDLLAENGYTWMQHHPMAKELSGAIAALEML